MPFSNMKPFILPSSFFAQTTKTSAIGLFDIHIFAPESEYPPFTDFALVIKPPASDP